MQISCFCIILSAHQFQHPLLILHPPFKLGNSLGVGSRPLCHSPHPTSHISYTQELQLHLNTTSSCGRTSRLGFLLGGFWVAVFRVTWPNYPIPILPSWCIASPRWPSMLPCLINSHGLHPLTHVTKLGQSILIVSFWLITDTCWFCLLPVSSPFHVPSQNHKLKPQSSLPRAIAWPL